MLAWTNQVVVMVAWRNEVVVMLAWRNEVVVMLAWRNEVVVMLAWRNQVVMMLAWMNRVVVACFKAQNSIYLRSDLNTMENIIHVNRRVRRHTKGSPVEFLRKVAIPTSLTENFTPLPACTRVSFKACSRTFPATREERKRP
jgi:hypothetical protein